MRIQQHVSRYVHQQVESITYLTHMQTQLLDNEQTSTVTHASTHHRTFVFAIGF